jgi:DNA-nicking Smr family endonuclease
VKIVIFTSLSTLGNKKIMNKYEQRPDLIVDLHGYTKIEAEEAIESFMKSGRYRHVRIITGKGTYREMGPVLRTFVQEYLVAHGVKFRTAKIADGGEGALEVFFK